MTIVDPLPRPVREIETLWIPLPDGCRLAARLWLPDGAERDPVPAIIEYLPYRRGDATAIEDSCNHPYLAAHRYACLRIDIRGTGDSDGTFTDEYTPQEQNDCVEAIAWIARQPWCSGAVGMWGISWGGFNALQVAARRPPALKAIITCCAADDRYADDTHYMGGCLLLGNLNWGANMFGRAALPPDPTVVGERWREMWQARLDAHPHLAGLWTRHQHRDGYWRQGSVCEDYAAIKCAVFAVGGWADSYTNAIPRLLAELQIPRLGLIGPWAHAFPHDARPGPEVGFLQEALRWWDFWLKGIDTGIMDEPLLRAWMQEAVPPASYYEAVPGRWVGESEWPSPRIITRRLGLTESGALAGDTGQGAPLVIASPQSLGTASGAWCPYGQIGDLPVDQSEDDENALVFDTAPLADRIELLGAPVLEAKVSADRPNAFLVARLSMLAPDGGATRVSYGVLNLTHRESHSAPAPLVPGELYRIRFRLNDIGQAVPAGYRIRLALSNTYWPTVWPSPESVTVMLYPEASVLTLPARQPRAEDADIRAFLPPEMSAPLVSITLRAPNRQRTVETVDGHLVVTANKDRGAQRLVGNAIEIDDKGLEIYAIAPDEPLSARGEMRWRNALSRDGWSARVETVTVQTATRNAFVFATSLDAYEGDHRVFARTWRFEIPRNLV